MSGLAQILVIEDDAAFNEMVCERLVERGYDVTSVARIPDALQALDRSRVDVILLDIKLDGPNGADVGIDALGRVLDRAPATQVPRQREVAHRPAPTDALSAAPALPIAAGRSVALADGRSVAPALAHAVSGFPFAADRWPLGSLRPPVAAEITDGGVCSEAPAAHVVGPALHPPLPAPAVAAAKRNRLAWAAQGPAIGRADRIGAATARSAARADRIGAAEVRSAARADRIGAADCAPCAPWVPSWGGKKNAGGTQLQKGAVETSFVSTL